MRLQAVQLLRPMSQKGELLNQTTNAALIWSVAELLRGDYKQSDYGKVVLPFTLLRRLDGVLAPTKSKVLAEYEARKNAGMGLSIFLTRAAGLSFYNTSKFDFPALLSEPSHIKANLLDYINSFSANTREIFERYDFANQIEKLDGADLLYKIVQTFAAIDLSPKAVSNTDMGLMFEELIRRFAELSNETAGEHYTPREVIRLMVDLLFNSDSEVLGKPGIVRSIYDPAAGTGGMLSVAEDHLRAQNPQAKLVAFGQELNAESYAVCKADMLIKGQDVENIAWGNTLSNDDHAQRQFDYMLSNPPFGVEWKKIEKAVRDEHKLKGFAGRFGPGLPRVSDGSLLFLLHLLSKMKPPSEGGSRVAIVLNGSPLFTGGAGSGESEIRKWVIENDWLETIIALPTDMFYNTGISTYIWVLSNHKDKRRRGKIQLINGAPFFRKMRKSLGSKRKELGEADIAQLVRWYGEFAAHEYSRIFENADFGYRTVTVERPLRDENGAIIRDKKGAPKADSSLRDTENIPLKDDVQSYFEREVLPHVNDAWMDESKTKIGYEIPFTRHFYEYSPPRPLSEIDAELKAVNAEIMKLLQEVTA
jgi:type I restriction enzyme M protein